MAVFNGIWSEIDTVMARRKKSRARASAASLAQCQPAAAYNGGLSLSSTLPSRNVTMADGAA